MLDFKITNSGDLAFSDDITSEEITIRFAIAEYPSFTVSFDTPQRMLNKKEKGLTIAFDTNKTLSLNDKFAAVHYDDEIAQAIRIRVWTELGELEKNEDIGSTLLLWKHKKIDDDMLNNIKSIIENIAIEITDSEEYSVEAIREEGTGNFYCQNVTVYIYREKDLIYQFYW